MTELEKIERARMYIDKLASFLNGDFKRKLFRFLIHSRLRPAIFNYLPQHVRYEEKAT